MLTSPQYVIPQIPVIYIVPRDTAYYQMFRGRNKIVDFIRQSKKENEWKCVYICCGCRFFFG